MPSVKRPRRGTLQFWPRKRARRIYPRTSTWPESKETKPLGFAGWKVGMTHVQFVDNSPTSPTRGRKISKAVTIIEAPALLVYAIRYYKNELSLTKCTGEKWADQLPKDIKKGKGKEASEYDNITLLVCTNPEKSGMKKKKREMFEIAIGGPAEGRKEYAESLLGKEFSAKDVFDSGEYIDVSGVTKGYGFTGPVKRVGIKIQRKKDQQMNRHPGSIGSVVPRKVSWTVPFAGQYGFFNRTEFTKRILSMGDDPKDINQKGGNLGYGPAKSSYIIVEGSVPGTRKRLIRLRKSFRPRKALAVDIDEISIESKQGV